jgi:hypothetical protein
MNLVTPAGKRKMVWERLLLADKRFFWLIKVLWASRLVLAPMYLPVFAAYIERNMFPKFMRVSGPHKRRKSSAVAHLSHISKDIKTCYCPAFKIRDSKPTGVRYFYHFHPNFFFEVCRPGANTGTRKYIAIKL